MVRSGTSSPVTVHRPSKSTLKAASTRNELENAQAEKLEAMAYLDVAGVPPGETIAARLVAVAKIWFEYPTHSKGSSDYVSRALRALLVKAGEVHYIYE